jgi:hypothetical protein
MIPAENAIATSSGAAPPNRSAANQSAKGKGPIYDTPQPKTIQGESTQTSARGKKRLKEISRLETIRGKSSRTSDKNGSMNFCNRTPYEGHIGILLHPGILEAL